jgi:hypothetical protein
MLDETPKIDFEAEGIIEEAVLPPSYGGLIVRPEWLRIYEAEVESMKKTGTWPPPANDPWWLSF